MAHESFEDEETASLMNEQFINIKVDREERPDLDKIYQNAHYLLSQRNGGWPLTIFLTAEDQVPFFSGTYFPPESRHGLPGFKELLHSVSGAYHEQGDAIREQNESLKTAMAQLQPGKPADNTQLEPGPGKIAADALKQQFDRQHGGFGNAPKFPHPDNLDFLLNGGHEDEQARSCAYLTLEKMALGGINDQLGGGFCRYSVDSQWMIPHFEKMLYDNGPLLALYADAWNRSGSPIFSNTCHGTANWVINEMQSPRGGYYSSLDADSEGEEGKYYVWSREEIEQALSAAEYEVLALKYGIKGKPNFEGKWHLHVHAASATIADRIDLTEIDVQQLLQQAQNKLLALRNQRTRPGQDDKILTSWNALMIYGMIHAGRILEQTAWVDSGLQALAFIRNELWRDGRLLAAHKDGLSHLNAYLDDHVLLIRALLEALQAQWNLDYLHWAMELADLLLEHFEDQSAGGFFFTADDHERLIQRPKSFTDDAMPSGNGIAARVLGELARLSGEIRYHEACERTLKAAWHSINRAPHAHASLLLALDEYLQPPEMLIIRTPPESTAQWQQASKAAQDSRRSIYLVPADETGLPTPLAAHQPQPNGSAWLCRGHECLPPADSPAALETQLKRGRRD